METINKREAWNKGKLVGQKPPLKPKDIWAIRIYLQNAHAVRDLAMFNLAIDSKLRGCDLVSLRVRDITHGNQVLPRAMVIQRKTQRPVQFELTEPTRVAVTAWLEKSGGQKQSLIAPRCRANLLSNFLESPARSATALNCIASASVGFPPSPVR
jgi:integrase